MGTKRRRWTIWEQLCVLTANDGCCMYCSIRASERMDHVIPLARGGADRIDNLVPACHRCNHSKNDKSFVEWWTHKWLKGAWPGGRGTPLRGGLEDAGLRELYLEAHQQVLLMLENIETVLDEIADERRSTWFIYGTGIGYPDSVMTIDRWRGWYGSRIEQAKAEGWPDPRAERQHI
ncbi:HNH endonuclease [Streptomyces lasalocidi]|uniref:HNH endonuclease n=1 Tax=Streptomyces lasalocidi TaxID=324833 RepID=A0A4V6AX95_STRLS|nr:HNH endonuclease signature motif containing protein [Streptomyces lasalocidi]TKS96412.1 HNH endonuclease [Streptomyces lasalocidi]